jgi:hypothetical protein
LTFEVTDYFKQQAAATAWDWLVEKPMSDSVYIDCPSGRSGQPSVEVIGRIIPGELDAVKPPVQCDEGRSATVIGLCLPIRSLYAKTFSAFS